MCRAGIGEALPHVDGRPVGVILEMENGFNTRHMGDTGVFGDLRLTGDMYRPGLVLILIGSHDAMNPVDDAMAVRGMIRPKVCHSHVLRHHAGVHCSPGLVIWQAAHAVAGAWAEVRLLIPAPQPLRRPCLPRLTCAHPVADVLLDLGQPQTGFSCLPPGDPAGPVLD